MNKNPHRKAEGTTSFAVVVAAAALFRHHHGWDVDISIFSPSRDHQISKTKISEEETANAISTFSIFLSMG